jgi:hypothetical protein
MKLSVPAGVSVTGVRSYSSLTKQVVDGSWSCDGRVGVVSCSLAGVDGSTVQVGPASYLLTVLTVRVSGVLPGATGLRFGVDAELAGGGVSSATAAVEFVDSRSPQGSSGSVNSGAGSGPTIPVTSVVNEPGYQGPLTVSMIAEGGSTVRRGSTATIMMDHFTTYPIPGGVTDDIAIPDGITVDPVNTNGWVCPGGTGTITCTHAGAVSGAGSSFDLIAHISDTAPLGFTIGAVASKSIDGVLSNQAILSLTVVNADGSSGTSETVDNTPAPAPDLVTSGFTVTPVLKAASETASTATLTVRNAGAATTVAPVVKLTVPSTLRASVIDSACVVTAGPGANATVTCTASSVLAAGTTAAPTASAPMRFGLTAVHGATTAVVTSQVTIGATSMTTTSAGLPISPETPAADAPVHANSVEKVGTSATAPAAGKPIKVARARNPELDAPVTAMSVPSAPTGVVAQEEGWKSQTINRPFVRIRWEPPASSGSSDIVRYRVFSQYGEHSNRCLGAGYGSTETTCYELYLGVADYRFYIKAVNRDGYESVASDWSNTISTYSTPWAPSSPSVSTSGSSATVSWSGASNNGLAITSYDVREVTTTKYAVSSSASCAPIAYSTTNSQYYANFSGNTCAWGTALWYTWNFNAPTAGTYALELEFFSSGLITGYILKVDGNVISNVGAAQSRTRDSVTGIPPKLQLPVTVTLTAGSHTFTTYTCQCNTNHAPNQWSAEWGTVGYGRWDDAWGLYVTKMDTASCSTTTATSCTVSGLSPGNHTFRVTATNARGIGNMSAAVSALVKQPPGSPTGVSATTGETTQSVVSWTAPTSSGDSAITGYTATSSPGGFTCTTTTATSCTVTGLTGGVSYTFTVKATSSAGDSPASTASSAIIPLGAPQPPTGVLATGGANAQSVVSWTAPSNNGGDAITGYTVTSSPGGFQCTTATTSCTVSGLTNGTSYTFTVTATNSKGTSTASSASSAVVPSTAPGAPTGVSGSGSTNQVVVSWSAPTSNGGATITGYTVSASPGGFVCTTTTATSCTVTGLTNGVSYTFTVTATNAAGTGAASTASSSVKPLGVPPAPLNPVQRFNWPTGVLSLTWDAPVSDGGSAITGYSVWVSGPYNQYVNLDASARSW